MTALTWTESPARQSLLTHPIRLPVFIGLVTFFTIYILSGILSRNEAEILKWEDGAIPISYVDKQWAAYVPAATEPPESGEDISSNYIHSPHSDEFYLPVYPSSRAYSATQTPEWQQIPRPCLEELIGNGASCTSRTELDQRIDVVWTWVNSSNAIWHKARASISARLTGKLRNVDVNDNKAMAHFRNYNELRHSVRSVLTHFRSYTQYFTIIASDFASSSQHAASSPPSQRFGQVPQWLDSSRDRSEWRDGDVQLKIQHHADLFEPYFETVFNGFAIESQLSHVQSNKDLFIYMNDDWYFMRDLKPADFFTSAFVFVFRLEYWTQVPASLDPKPERGEWQALRESNALIGQRFGPTTRPYRAHMPKIMSVSLLREIAETFPDAFARTGARPMRAVWLHGEAGDVHPGFMFVHFVVERWREGLLWSWAVARVGGDDDAWNAAAAWAELKGGEEDIMVGSIVRETLSNTMRQLADAGYEGPEASQYYFSSMDGYPYYEVRQNETMEHPNLSNSDLCTISREECFPPWITSASEAFKHIAFARPHCGDCVINRLVQHSGRRGLSAVLPAPERRFATTARGPMAETLPRVPDWQLGVFALTDVLAQAPKPETIDVRAWILRMLNRYRFVLADSQYVFARLNSERNAHSQLDRLQGHGRAFACVNDDVEIDEEAVAVEGVIREWQGTRWNTPARWEAT